MKMSSEKKKQQKKKQRERRVKDKKIHEQSRAIRQAKLDEYPIIRTGRRDADPEFIKAVEDAAKSIDFLDDKVVGLPHKEFYRLGKRHGFPAVFADLQHETENEPNLLPLLLLTLGSQILDRVPSDVRRKHMPCNDVMVAFEGRDIVLHFSSIRWQSGSGGRIFYSPLKPKILFEKAEYIVGFSKHAIERICKRIKPNYIDYGACGDIHVFLRSCVYFEPVVLYGDQPAFVLYNRCDHPSFADYQTYTVEVLGLENLVDGVGPPYYKIGYCPVVFEAGFAKAKTFLPPGFTSTPEYGLLLKSGLQREVKDRFISKVTDESWTHSGVLLNNDHEVIKWFHSNGMPQVIQMKTEVFSYPRA
jgi:hypothetical protein